MQYRKLGNTGLEVSCIGLGCAQLGNSTTEYGVRLVQRALDLGINYFDAARGYWDAEVCADDLKQGVTAGRPYLVLSHCVWSVQRSVRFDDYIFIRTYHPGLKNLPSYMLFDVKNDPHETNNLADERPDLVGKALSMLDEWPTLDGDARGRPVPHPRPTGELLQAA